MIVFVLTTLSLIEKLRELSEKILRSKRSAMMYGALLCDEASSDASVRERNIVENEKVGPAKKARKVGHRQSWMPRPAAKISYTAVISASSSTNRESFTLIHEPSVWVGRNPMDSPIIQVELRLPVD